MLEKRYNASETMGSSIAKIEFLYWEGCPSHERALELLRQVVAEERVDIPITIIRVDTEEETVPLDFYGSPTIRVNGLDIDTLPGDLPQPGLACRAYRRVDGRISPLPPIELIRAAFRRPALV